MEYKTCSKCKRDLPATLAYFFKYGANDERLRSVCKECKGLSFTLNKRYDTPKPGYKFCSKCNRELPANFDYFNRNSKLKSELNSWCKECCGNGFTIKRIVKPGYKFCSKCEEEKPATEEFFNSNKNSSDGLNNHCRECRKQYHVENRERIINYVKQYRIQNRKIVLARKKEYNQTEKAKQSLRDYCNRNKEKLNIKYQRRKARIKKLKNDFTSTDWVECLDYFNHKCAYCGASNINLQQDHIIPLYSKGPYTKFNIAPACISCNCSKNNKDLIVWYKDQSFFKNNKLEKILNWHKKLS